MHSAATNSARACAGSTGRGGSWRATEERSGREARFRQTPGVRRQERIEEPADQGHRLSAGAEERAAAAASSTVTILVPVSHATSYLTNSRAACATCCAVTAEHAAVVDGAVAEQAGAGNPRAGAGCGNGGRRRGGNPVGGSEDGEGGARPTRSDMHGAGIVGQEQTAGGGQLDELRQRGLSAMFRTRQPLWRIWPASRRHNACSLGEPNKTTPAWSEAASRVAASTKRSGSHCLARLFSAPGLMPMTGRGKFRDWNRVLGRCGGLRRRRGAEWARRAATREDSGAAQEFEVVEALVARDFAGTPAAGWRR